MIILANSQYNTSPGAALIYRTKRLGNTALVNLYACVSSELVSLIVSCVCVFRVSGSDGVYPDSRTLQ